MKKIAVVMMLLIGSMVAFSQTTPSAIAEAVRYLQEKGYSTQVDQNAITATSDDITFTLSVVSNEAPPISWVIITSNLHTYSNESRSDVLDFANTLNASIPFLKFTVGDIMAGDYALINGGDPNDMYYSVSCTAFSYFQTVEELRLILSFQIDQFKALKAEFPSSLD